MTLKLAETSVVKSRSSVPYGANYLNFYFDVYVCVIARYWSGCKRPCTARCIMYHVRRKSAGVQMAWFLLGSSRKVTFIATGDKDKVTSKLELLTQKMRSQNSRLNTLSTQIQSFITGPPTHSVRGQTSIVMLSGVCRHRLSSSSVVVCNTHGAIIRLESALPAQARRLRHAASSIIIAPR